jgi:hypothetical protein
VQDVVIYFCITLDVKNAAIYVFMTILALRWFDLSFFPFVAKVLTYQSIMENITFFDFETNIYEEKRDVGATMLESSKIIASHTIEQHI